MTHFPKYLILSLVLIFLGCKQDPIPEKESFPKLILELNSDTLSAGDILELKISFSDTSLFYVFNHKMRKRRIVPAFKIGDEHVENNDDTYTFRDTVKIVRNRTQKYHWREITAGITYPHPEFAEGDITQTKVVTYTVVNDRPLVDFQILYSDNCDDSQTANILIDSLNELRHLLEAKNIAFEYAPEMSCGYKLIKKGYSLKTNGLIRSNELSKKIKETFDIDIVL